MCIVVSKPVARSVLQGWRNCTGGITWYKNLRAYFILHVVTIKWIMSVQENIELSSMSQRPRLSYSIIYGDYSLATRIMQ